MNYEKIGEFIQTKRKEKNLTQKELASKIGVTDKAVSKWERGLGCPDVSILEILAKELDVSILEILKGRIIENEVIKVTEMNDYVSYTLDYSKESNKEKIKNVINKIVIISIIMIVTLLTIFNIINIIKLNKTYTYDFNSKEMKKIKENINKIDDNINIIKNNQGIYSDEDYFEIVSSLDSNKDILNNYLMLKYEGKKDLKMVDIYAIDVSRNYLLGSVSILRTISKYDKKSDYLDQYTDYYLTRILSSQSFYDITNKSYRYQFINIPNEIEYMYEPLIDPISTRVYNLKTDINIYLYITNKVIEVGELND